MIADKKKVSFQIVSKYNGIDYKSGRISFSPTKLEEIGIDEDNPVVQVIYDETNQQIIIKAAPAY